MKNSFLIQNKWILCFTVAALYGLQSCSEGGEKAEKKQAPEKGAAAMTVEGMVVQADKVDDKIFATGTLLPNEEVELRPEISGRVVGIYFEEGSRVKAGQLLVKIDDRELKAQLNRVKVQQKLAASEEGRQKQLLDINAVSQEEYDISLNQLNTLEADASLLETQIDKTSIYAPFSGVVGLRSISQGGYVTPTSLLASMQQLDPVKIEFSVPERYSSEIREGTSVNFAVAGVDKTFPAKVYAVDSKIDVNTRTARIRARSANPENMLRPGAFARVEVILKTYDDAILVPAEAIVTELEGQQVFVARDGKARAQKVKTGVRTERVVQIVEGLAPRDTVVLTGLMSIEEGSKLNFKELKEPKLEVDIEQPKNTL